jgi:hypothetical protein
MKYFIALMLICGLLFSQVLYEEYFTDGTMQLDWGPWFTDSLGIGDSMGVINDPTTPGGDSWAGRISNEYMGAAGLTYAGASSLVDYSIEAWVYTLVTTAAGPYNGIAIRMNPSTRYLYRLVSDFDNSARLRLGLIGYQGYPVVLRDWASSEIPGGVPSSSSWHKLKLKVVADSIWAYYDEQMLPGCPIINDSVSSGYFGMYVFNMSDTTSTKCDNVIVQAEGTSIVEHDIDREATFSVAPNPFRYKTVISFGKAQNTQCSVPGGRESSSFRRDRELKIYDATGRLVKSFDLPTLYSLHPTLTTWDGKDDWGNIAAPGVYFIVDDYGNTLRNVVKLH